jgi:aspartate/methionine/tyrosine aminotransferase
MQIDTFVMERMQSVWENQVRYNLSESGVHPMTMEELADPREIGSTPLGYTQTNGSARLRETISGLYPGANPENILVTNGTAEANFITAWRLIEPGDHVVLMVPNYMQLWGVVRALGGAVSAWHLREERRWAPELSDLDRLISPRTKLIAICNPNNPTGAVLSDAAMNAICRAASNVGAWVLADEVYRGAELDSVETPSFWGRYDRLLVASGLSKAYGLPGLRVGWLAGPRDVVADLWRYKDYTTIGPSALSDRLAQIALTEPKRTAILERTRGIIRAQFPIVQRWAAEQGVFHLTPPRAGAIAYLRYDVDVNSGELAERLRRQKSVLIVPGEQFDMDRFVRIGTGGNRADLEAGLELFSEALSTMRATAPAPPGA